MPTIAADRTSYQANAQKAASAVNTLRHIQESMNSGAPGTKDPSAFQNAYRSALTSLKDAQTGANADFHNMAADGADKGEIAHDADFMNALNDLAGSAVKDTPLKDSDAMDLFNKANDANSANLDFANHGGQGTDYQGDANSDQFYQGAVSDAFTKSSDPTPTREGPEVVL